MLISTRGTVRAWEGCLVLDVEPPPRTLAEAMASPDDERWLSEILMETGINAGPVEVEFEVLFSEPAEDTRPVWEDIWEDLDLLLPEGSAYLHGPGEADVLQLGTIEKPTLYRFRVYATGRDRMRDLVATEVIERYLVQVWEA